MYNNINPRLKLRSDQDRSFLNLESWKLFLIALQAANLPSLNERLRKLSGWGVTDPNYLTMVDNNRVFMECLVDQAKAERSKTCSW